ncbi:hypothetical protein T12_14906 [Trichinella patagoniensis]|uniref:HTH CENPB-type domain-containing protein n=1 Tax=Trichinella patagoniensis TaxID=990121 RepID=A0A0V0ZMQ1_9BILA|nr:hypothetical protein T12_14906 [Trichinella patagoniensis]
MRIQIRNCELSNIRLSGSKRVHRGAVARCAFDTSLSLAKRKSFSLKEKVAVVNALNDGTKNASVCEQFALSKSTVSAIWKIEALFQMAKSNWNPNQWAILKIKAEQFATMLGYTNFTCMTGWLDRFKAGHNICSGPLCSSTNRRESIFQFDEISELDDYVDVDNAVITSYVPTMDDIANDIHCAKQKYSDGSDRETATAKTIPLKTYPELNECVDHL